MIYFLKANDRVKIGYSHDPVSRIASLQTSSPYDLETLLLIDGTLDEEKELHTKFSMKRRSGEWFELDEELQLFIDTNMVHDRRYEFGLGPNVDFSGREQIKRLRLKHNMTGIKLGELLGITNVAICQTEKREINGGITIKAMDKIADVLGYKFEYRFTPKNKLDHEENEDST